MVLLGRKKQLSDIDPAVGQFGDLTRTVLGRSIAGYLAKVADLPSDTFGVGRAKINGLETDRSGQVQSFAIVVPLQRKRGLLASVLCLSRYKKIGDLTVCRDVSRNLCSAYLASDCLFGLKPSPMLDYAPTPDCASARVATDDLPSETDVLSCVADKQIMNIGNKIIERNGYNVCLPRNENIKLAVLGL